MVQILPSSLRYRTKAEIAKDIAFILSAPVMYGTKCAVIREAMWVWTEMDGKYIGCPYWTEMALLQYCVVRKEKHKFKRLRHEHVVPKMVVAKMLFDLSSPTTESVRAICDQFLIGVVVTVEEDSVLNEFRRSMPPEFSDPKHPEYRDPWSRYKRCGITRISVKPSTFENLEAIIQDATTKVLQG